MHSGTKTFIFGDMKLNCSAVKTIDTFRGKKGGNFMTPTVKDGVEALCCGGILAAGGTGALH